MRKNVYLNVCLKLFFWLVFNKMPGQKEERVRRRRSSSKRKSAAQKRHQERAKKAMELWKSGKASSLKAAWRKV